MQMIELDLTGSETAYDMIDSHGSRFLFYLDFGVRAVDLQERVSLKRLDAETTSLEFRRL